MILLLLLLILQIALSSNKPNEEQTDIGADLYKNDLKFFGINHKKRD